ncbi:MAG: AAC(3) family N-acetyltransferase [Chloroflexota bacterium]
MITYRDLTLALRDVGLTEESRLLAHVSLPALDPIRGGAETVLGALLASCQALLMPAFTYRTMVVPRTGPPENGLTYDQEEANAEAEVFDPRMPVDSELGEVAEALRRHPAARRSSHPILSFSGVNAAEALAAQTLDDPWAPIAALAEVDGDVLLLGADHSANVCLHYAEKLAGRKQFVRWALVPGRIVACPGFPGCPDGFPAIGPRLAGVARLARLGQTTVELIPLRDLIHIAVGWIHQDPRALLCHRRECERCRDVRAAVRQAV